MIYLVLSISLIILLFIYGCKPGDNNYSVQDEEYLIGHIVRNVDDNTPEVIDFRNNRNELAVYNYTFAYPAYNPEYYVNALWFFEPMASFSSGVAFNNQIAGALNRIYYIFADNRFSQTYNNDKWDFLNKNQINYLNKNDLNIADEIKNEFDQRYLDVSFYENDEFKEPDAGEIQEFTVGKAPYKITNLLVNKGADSYRLSWYSLLVYANKGKAFLERSVFFPNFILDYPYYTIFKDGAIMVNNNLTDEYGNWISPLDYKFIGDAQGTYKVNLHIPTLYPVFEQIDSEYEFSLPQQDAQPPILNLIDIPARFEANKELNIRVNVLEVSGLKQFRILYSRNNNLDDAAWLDLPVNLIDDNNDGNNNNLYDYNASIIISSNSDNFEKINLRIIAIDNNDNKVSSTIKAASLKAREVNFGLKASKTNAARGDSIIFSGECKDDIGNGCKGLRIGYYIDEGIDGSNEKFLDADMTKFQRLETYDDEYRIIDYTYEPASFTYPWQVPINYDKSTIKFKLKFDGTGVYLPKEESVTINIGAVNYDIALTDLTIKNFEFNKEAKINVTVTNVGISKAENIDVKLQIDARVEDTKTIQSLEPNQAVNVSFSYIPKKAGSTAIIVASNYLKDENLDNNNQKATRDVQGTGSDVAIRRKDYSGLMAINDTKFLAYLVKNFGQSKAENISLKVYDLFDGQYIWLRYNELNVIVHKGIEYRITAQQTGANNNEVNLSFEYISGSTDVKENFALKDDVSGNGPEGIYILKNGIGIVYLGVYNDGIGIELANLAYLEKNIADLDELEQREENITWDTKIFGWHNLFSFVNVSNDIDYTNNVRSDILRVVEDKPDLIITEFGIFGLDHNNYAVLNNEYNISVRILNDGIRESDEFDAVFTDFYDLTYAYVNEEETRGIFIDGKEYRIAAKINYSSTEPIKSNVELEIRYEDAVERLTLRLGEVKVLGNGKNIALQFISPNTARMSFGSAKHHLVRIPKIKPNEYYEISGLKWKPNKTGEHRLISNLNTTYDYDTSNNVNEIWKSVARDLPDLDITKNTEEDEYGNNIIIGTAKPLNYKITNYGIKNATNVDAILYDMFNLRYFNAELSAQEEIENSIDYNNTEYNIIVRLEELPEQEKEQNSGKIANFKIRYSLNGQEVIEQFKLRRNRIYELKNSEYLILDYYEDNYGNGDYQNQLTGSFAVGNKQATNFAQINVNEEYNHSVSWQPKSSGYHYVFMFLNLTDDNYWENNINRNYFEVKESGVDLISRIETTDAEVFNGYYLYTVNKTNPISLKIKNAGNAVSENAVIEVSAKKEKSGENEKTSASIEEDTEINKLIASQNIGILQPNETKSYNVTLSFNELGSYQINVYVNESKDVDKDNNYDYRYVKVIPDAAHLSLGIDIEYPTLLNKINKVNIELNNLKKQKAENISLYLFEQKLNKDEKIYEEREEGGGQQSSLVANLKLNEIDGSSKISVNFNWTPSEYSIYILTAVVNYTSEGSDKIFTNKHSIYPYVQVNNSEVQVYRVYIIGANTNILEVNKEVKVRVDLSNNGLQRADNVVVKLFANNQIVGEKTLSINAGYYEQEKFVWKPAEEGDYILKAVAEVTNDFTNSNNEYNMTFTVGHVVNVSVNITDSPGNAVNRQLKIGKSELNVNGQRKVKINSREKYLAVISQQDYSTNENNRYTGFSYSLPVVQEKLDLISEYYIIKKSENHLLLHNIFINKINWQYDNLFFYASIPITDISTGAITEMELVYCEDFSATNKSCNKTWHRTKNDGLVISPDNIFMQAIINKAQAFALAEKDFDEDGIVDREDNDDDNDGILDDKDKVKGNNTLANTNIKNFTLKISDKDNLSEAFNKTEVVKFADDNKPRLEFKFNFTNKVLDLEKIIVETKQDGISGGMFVSGLELEKGETKTFYIDDLSISNEICIKDAEIENLANITQACNEVNETLLFCPGNFSAPSTGSNYRCENTVINSTSVNNSNIKLYKISGLRNSGVQELANCIEQWSCSEWTSCSSNRQARACNDAKKCGTTTAMPALEQSCGIRDSDSNGRSISRSGELISIGILENGAMKSVEIMRYDRVRFVMDNNVYHMETELIGKSNAEISIKPGYANVDLQLTTPLKLDLNDNGINDIIIILTNINENKATFSLQNLNEVIENEQNLNALILLRKINRTITTPDDISIVVQNITIAKKDIKDIKKDNLSLKGWALLGLAILTFIGVLTYVTSIQGKKRSEKRKWAIEKYYMEHGKLPPGLKQEEHQMYLQHKLYSQNKQANNVQQKQVKNQQYTEQVQKAAEKTAHHEVLAMFINNLKEKNYSREQIMHDLVKRGWNPRDVEHAIKQQESKQVYSNIDSLVAFIEDAFQRGYKHDQIAKSLHSKGWPKEIIMKVFREEKRLRKYLR